MLNELIDHSADLKKLWDEGYELQVSEGHLLIHNVPYVNSKQEIARGILVSVLDLAGNVTSKPSTHVAFFVGDYPCNSDGSKINIVIQSQKQKFGEKVEIDHTLSGKADYVDFYQKISRYISIITGPVNAIDDTYSAKTFQIFEADDEETVFEYLDTNSSRAHINPITNKLKGQKVAIVGLGGTGSYLLDFIAKTPVQEIHLYDEDSFLQHNAFRAPGALPKRRFFEHLKKVDYLAEVYSSMHKNITPHCVYLTEANLSELDGKDFVFIAMDSGKAKRDIITYLEASSISFIDCGIGLEAIDGALKGQVRVTTSTSQKRDHISSRISFAETTDDLYNQNIQMAELNALNATLAIVKWKKLSGFYKEHENEHHSTYVIYTNEITSDDFPV